MTFWEGLLCARHHIIFLLGLLTAFGLITQLETVRQRQAATRSFELNLSDGIPRARQGPLTAEQMAWGRIAWRYFERNYRPATGLVNSVDGHTTTTMWDTASYLLGMISAHRLGILEKAEFDRRLSQALTTLARMPLFQDRLPNKVYDTETLAMVDSGNQPSERGTGWSAMDIGRVLVPLHIIAWNYPEHLAEVRAIVGRWDFAQLLKDGQLCGAVMNDQGEVTCLQEGRIGYEEYAAKSLALMGYDAVRALDYADGLRFVEIYGIEVPTDNREPGRHHARNYVVSEPYILDGIEFGWDHISREFAYRVYKAQEKRFQATKVLTAVSEDHIDEAPGFVYNTVVTFGKPWNTVTEKGENASAFRSLSTKTAIGWYALYDSDYTQKLVDRAKTLFDPDRGWYSGWYEVKDRPNKAITANTNGIILESLHHLRFGKLVAVYSSDTGAAAETSTLSTGSAPTSPAAASTAEPEKESKKPVQKPAVHSRSLSSGKGKVRRTGDSPSERKTSSSASKKSPGKKPSKSAAKGIRERR
ncbi:MAG TPA: DUF3131 domain-containing protein [Methylococcus sp.]|nr:DUF3131 domain-containing protein [Methylococcus sp.]